jgi:hypothetical protein
MSKSSDCFRVCQYFNSLYCHAGKWATFYDTAASPLDVFLPAVDFPWVLLQNTTAVTPVEGGAPTESHFTLVPASLVHEAGDHFSQYHALVVSQPETFVADTVHPYMLPGTTTTACQSCGSGLAFCRPSELTPFATNAMFQQGHKVNMSCPLVSYQPWDAGNTEGVALALNVPVEYQLFTDYFEHAVCAPGVQCLLSFKRHLCLVGHAFSFSQQPLRVRNVVAACEALLRGGRGSPRATCRASGGEGRGFEDWAQNAARPEEWLEELGSLCK